MDYGILLFIHILLMVFWLGTDIGVFVLGRYAMRDSYPPEQRLAFLEVAMILDIFPRVCFSIMGAVGIHLAVKLGFLELPGGALAGVWAASFFWFCLVGVAVVKHDQPPAFLARKIERALQVVLTLVFIGVGTMAFTGAEWASFPGWLAAKWIAFGLITATAVGLDAAFKPAIEGFGALAVDGSSPAVEEKIQKGMNLTYFWVVCVYILVLISGGLGAIKPG
ncbi:MAG: hypothetical protein AAGE01_08815 [Pseudomonadota bacterium]